MAHWHGRAVSGFWLTIGLVTLGLTSGCVTYAPSVSDKATEAYLLGQTDELPPGLPPEMAAYVKQSRKEVEQGMRDGRKSVERSTAASAQAEQEYLRLPEGYSAPILDAKIPCAVVVTGTGSLDVAGTFGSSLVGIPESAGAAFTAKLKADMEVEKARAAASERRQASSQASVEGRRRQARIRAVHALLHGKVFRQILPTEDMSSPLVTDEALFLHVDQTMGVEMKQTATVMVGMQTERWSGVLRDVRGAGIPACESEFNWQAGMPAPLAGGLRRYRRQIGSFLRCARHVVVGPRLAAPRRVGDSSPVERSGVLWSRRAMNRPTTNGPRTAQSLRPPSCPTSCSRPLSRREVRQEVWQEARFTCGRRPLERNGPWNRLSTP